LVEVLLAVSIFGLVVTVLTGGLIYGQQSTAMAGMRARTAILADEGLEAARNIRDENYANLTDGTFGLAISGNQWNFSGASDTTDVFTRTIAIYAVDANRKMVTSAVTWQQNPQRSGLAQTVTYLTNWRSVSAPTTCGEYAVGQGYASGTCRQNTQQCTNNSETYLSGGDAFCTGSPSVDTCCAFTGPTPTPTPTSGPTPTPASTCAGYCQSLGTYSTGTCRKGVPQCNANGETHESGGNSLCQQAEGGTCCCAP
ncbi:MAG: hypothetical protein AABZ07_05540, partial [Nitrospirota bacterium]